MSVTRILIAGADIELDGEGEPPAQEAARRLLGRGALCSNASLGERADDRSQASGDPTEIALLVAAAAAGLQREQLLQEAPELREDPFDADHKRMATVHNGPDGPFAAVKGAPETLLPLCSSELSGDGESVLDDGGRDRWLKRAEELAAEGLRTLAIAERRLDDAQAPVYAGLTLLGIVGMEDPPRRSSTPNAPWSWPPTISTRSSR